MLIAEPKLQKGNLNVRRIRLAQRCRTLFHFTCCNAQCPKLQPFLPPTASSSSPAPGILASGLPTPDARYWKARSPTLPSHEFAICETSVSARSANGVNALTSTPLNVPSSEQRTNLDQAMDVAKQHPENPEWPDVVRVAQQMRDLFDGL